MWREFGTKRMNDLADMIMQHNTNYPNRCIDQPSAIWYRKLPCSSNILLIRAWGTKVYTFSQSSGLSAAHVVDALERDSGITMSVKNLREISNAVMEVIDMVKGGSL